MVINRNNYEEYFLLYTDGELPASERQLVELFVLQNADLADELQLLLHTKLEWDNTVIPDKSSLYRHTCCRIDEANYEELFLLYIDNELNEDEKSEVESFLLQNPAKQKNFADLKQTKLLPEKVVFKNKDALYKKRKTTVLLISWTRVAVAATFIGLLLGTWSLLPSKIVKVKNTIVINLNAPKTAKSVAGVAAEPIIKQPGITTGYVVSKKTFRNNGKKRKALLLSKQENLPTLPMQKSFIAITKEQKPNPDLNEKQATIAVIKHENNKREEQEITLPISQHLPNISNSADNDSKKNIQKTVYKELDTEDATKNNNIYIGNLQINKYKLAGLLKRASHIFNKANDDENSIAIANFTINKSLR